MLDEIIVLPLEERQAIFVKAAFELGIVEPLIVEKDFWVSWILEKLFFSHSKLPEMTFKGGTSLSKGYQLIQRFSEDVDITISRECLGFQEKDAEIMQLGNKRRKRFFEELFNKTLLSIQESILPYLQQVTGELLIENWSLRIKEDEPETIIFNYPSCFKTAANNYRELLLGQCGKWNSFKPCSIL